MNNYSSTSIATTDAIEYAKTYGTAKGGTGRLITVEEVLALGGNTSSESSSNCPSWINSSNYWLGSAGDASCVWRVYGVYRTLDYRNFDDVGAFGVRPVIEISKSLIQ